MLLRRGLRLRPRAYAIRPYRGVPEGTRRALWCQDNSPVGALPQARPHRAAPALSTAVGVVCLATAVAGLLSTGLPGSSAHVSRGVLHTPARAPGGAVHVVPTGRGLEVDGRGLRVRITRQPWQI